LYLFFAPKFRFFFFFFGCFNSIEKRVLRAAEGCFYCWIKRRDDRKTIWYFDCPWERECCQYVTYRISSSVVGCIVFLYVDFSPFFGRWTWPFSHLAVDSNHRPTLLMSSPSEMKWIKNVRVKDFDVHQIFKIKIKKFLCETWEIRT
jgi:hypothetical protein